MILTIHLNAYDWSRLSYLLNSPHILSAIVLRYEKNQIYTLVAGDVDCEYNALLLTVSIAGDLKLPTAAAAVQQVQFRFAACGGGEPLTTTLIEHMFYVSISQGI
jgi:hypothetical protein